MEMLYGVVAALLGVIVGGVLQYFTSQRTIDRQHQWDRSLIVQEKLELIAQATEDMSQRMRRLYAGAIPSVGEGKPYNPGIDLPFAKLEMLLSFYAPGLKSDYNRLVALRDEMGSTVVDLVTGKMPAEKKDKQVLNEKLIKASIKAEKICASIIAGASKMGREHLGLNVEQPIQPTLVLRAADSEH